MCTILKDVHDSKIQHKDQYTIIQVILIRKSMKRLAVPDEKYSVSIKLLTVKNNSQADMRTSHGQLLEKGFERKTPKIKFKIKAFGKRL